MYCLACDKKLKDIQADKTFPYWNRKYHKKCWIESLIYLEMIEKHPNLKDEYIIKKACLK